MSSPSLEFALLMNTSTVKHGMKQAKGDVAAGMRLIAQVAKEKSQEIQSALGKITALRELNRGLAESRVAFVTASGSVSQLKKDLGSAMAPVRALSQELAQARVVSGAAKEGLDRQTESLKVYRTSVDQAKVALIGAKGEVKRLGDEVRNAAPPTDALRQALDHAKTASAAASVEYNRQRDNLRLLRAGVVSTRQEWMAAKRTISSLATSIAQATTPVKNLQQALDTAKKHASEVRTEFGKQQAAIGALKRSLENAGHSTVQLGQTQRRLRSELAATEESFKRQARAMQRIHEAKKVLGFRFKADTSVREIKKLIAAYNRLERSGELSATAITRAYALLQQRIAKIQEEIHKNTQSFKDFQALGIRSTADIQREIQNLAAAYARLRDSGKETAADLDRALASLRSKTRQLQISIYQGSQSFQDFSTLGIRSVKSVRLEVDALNAAYQRIKSSGSENEKTRALQAVKTKVKELNSSLKVVEQDFKVFGMLGIRSAASVKREINNLTAAYGQLKVAGYSSGENLTRAHAALKAKIAELNGTLKEVQPGFEIFEMLGLRSTRAVKQEISKLSAVFQNFKNVSTVSAKEIARVQTALNARFTELRGSIKSVEPGFRLFEMLGVRSVKSVRTEIASLNAVYAEFAANASTASTRSREVARANELVKARVAELHASVHGASKQFSIFGMLGIRSATSVKREIEKLKAEYSKFANAVGPGSDSAARVLDVMKAKIVQLRRSISQTDNSFKIFGMLGTRSAVDIRREMGTLQSEFDRFRSTAGAGPREVARLLVLLKEKLAGLLKEITGTKKEFEIFGMLGVRSAASVTREITALRGAYHSFVTSAHRGGENVAQVHKALQDRIRALRGGTRELGQGFKIFEMLGIRSSRSVRQEIKSLRQAFMAFSAQAGRSTRDVARAQVVLRQRVTELRSGLQQNTQSWRDFQTLGVRSTRDIKAEITKLEHAYIRLAARTGASSSDILRAHAAMKAKILQLNGEISGSFKKVGDDVQGTSSAFNLLRNAIAGLGMLAVARNVVETGLTFERLNAILFTLANSTRGASQEFAFAKDIADKLGLSLDATVESYGKFAVGSRMAGLGANKIREIFESVAKSSAAMKLSAVDLKGVFIALTQMMSKGTVQAEELRGQLGDRLPGAFSLAAQAMGITERELNKMMKVGNLMSSELIPKLAKVLEKKFGPAAIRASQGALAAFNRFYNTLTEKKNLIAEQINPVLGAIGTNISKSLNSPEVTASIKSFAKNLGSLIKFTAEYAPLIAKVTGALIAWTLAKKAAAIAGRVLLAVIGASWSTALAHAGATTTTAALATGRFTIALVALRSAMAANFMAGFAASAATAATAIKAITLATLAFVATPVGGALISLGVGYLYLTSRIEKTIEADKKLLEIGKKKLEQTEYFLDKVKELREAGIDPEQMTQEGQIDSVIKKIAHAVYAGTLAFSKAQKVMVVYISQLKRHKKLLEEITETETNYKTSIDLTRKAILKAISTSDMQLKKHKTGLSASLTTLKKSAQVLSASWANAQTSTADATKRASEEITDLYRKRHLVLEEMSARRVLSERDKATKHINLVVDENAERINLADKNNHTLIRLEDQRYLSLKKYLKHLGVSTQVADAKLLKAKKDILSRTRDAYRSNISKLISEEHRLLQAVKQTTNQQMSFRRSVADRLARLNEVGKKSSEIYTSRQSRIEKSKAAAVRALREGDYTSAKRHAAKMMELAEQNVGVVKDGRRVIVTEKQSALTAIKQVEAAESITNKAFERQKRDQKKGIDKVRNSYQQLIPTLMEVENKLKLIRAFTLRTHTINMAVEMDSIKAAAKQIDKLLPLKERVIKIRAALVQGDDSLRTLLDKLRKGAFDQVELAVSDIEKTFKKYEEAVKGWEPKLKVRFKPLEINTALEGLRRKIEEFKPPEVKIPLDELSLDKKRAAVDDLVNGLGRIGSFFADGLSNNLGESVSDATRKVSILAESLLKFEDGSTEKYKQTIHLRAEEAQRKVEFLLKTFNKLVEKAKEPIRVKIIEEYEGMFESRDRGQRFQRGFQRGGQLPGWGGGDRINALLEQGEWVIRKEAVKKYGSGLFSALNSMTAGASQMMFNAGGFVDRMVFPQMPDIPKFATGGQVASSRASDSGQTIRIDLSFGGGEVFPVQSDSETASRLLKHLNGMSRGRR